MRQELLQEELAELTNTNTHSISNIVLGITDIKFSTLDRLEETLNIDI